MTILNRAGGVLLHPISLPSKYGIGDFGPEAYAFVDFLKLCKQSHWQMLPLGPVGFGESPYQSFSAFAGNPLLISIDKLIEEGLLLPQDISVPCEFPAKIIDYPRVKEYKLKLFKVAYSNFLVKGSNNSFEQFKKNNKEWLESFTQFMALKDYYNSEWVKWDKKIELNHSIKKKQDFHAFLQYKFFTQWAKLKAYANNTGIKIIGDLPIFVAHDSNDVWNNPRLFKLDSRCYPQVVAGVPPDYFSTTGQLWGNPLYDWEKMKEDDYYWWRQRFKHLLKYVDLVRIDHFRGFEAAWQIPATGKTAIDGKWVKGPGFGFFSVLEKHLGRLPVIAEDLGFITREVLALKNYFSYPGMGILQFAFEGGKKILFSTLTDTNSVIYTGTHDNDTIIGWYNKCIEASPKVINLAKKHFNINTTMTNEDISWGFIEIALSSNAKLSIIPLQDVFCLGSSARMNLPGTVGDNWNWRFEKKDLSLITANKLAQMTLKYKRGLNK